MAGRNFSIANASLWTQKINENNQAQISINFSVKLPSFFERVGCELGGVLRVSSYAVNGAVQLDYSAAELAYINHNTE